MTAKKEDTKSSTTEGVENKDTTKVDPSKTSKIDEKGDSTLTKDDAKGDGTKATAKDGEVTVHVDTTKAEDKDPSTDIPLAQHTEGTGGVQGIQAGSAAPRVSSTGNAGSEQPVKPNIDETATQKYERKDIRDLQPSKLKAEKKAAEKKESTDYSLEVDGEETEELTLREAADKAVEHMVRGSTSPIVHRKGKRFVTFVASGSQDGKGQKHIELKPEDGAISDDEAEVLNSYNSRVLTGTL
jgi:hypothetical protein